MDFQPLKYIYQPSEKKTGTTLLLLHGTGGDEHDLLPIARYFGNDLNVLSLRGNVSEHGMPRFFKRLGIGVFDEEDLAFRTHEMVSFLKSIAEQEGFDADKLIALGYSNGANIAGSTLFLYPGFFAGALLYRPMQPFKSLPEVHDQKHTPVFMSNGLEDPTIDPEDTAVYTQYLEKAGFRLSHHQLATGHGFAQEDLTLSLDWYRKNFDHGSL